MYNSAEATRQKLLISVPSSLSSIDTFTKSVISFVPPKCNQVYTLPIISFPNAFTLQSFQHDCPDHSFYPFVNSVYCYTSGTDICLSKSIIRRLLIDYTQYRIYGNKLVPGLIDNQSLVSPTRINSILPAFCLSRAGWGVSWYCLVHRIPLILLKPTIYDDPEIWCNYQTLVSFQLALNEDDLGLPNSLLVHKLRNVFQCQSLTLDALRVSQANITAGNAIIADD